MSIRAASPRTIGLAALCVTTTTSYGTLYYPFPVLAGDIVADTGWSRTAITAAFSLGSLTGAALGVPVGRIIGRRGPRAVMSAASLLGVLALLLVAAAPTFPLFVLGWLAAGASTAGLYYAPAFAALTAWYGPDRVRALTTLTLVAGFSSTIFAPFTALLASHMTWRAVYITLASILLAVTLPLHVAALRIPWPFAGHDHRRPAAKGVTRSRQFVLLGAASALLQLVSFASLVQLVALLTGRGLSATAAAWALGLGGAGQVAGRLLYTPLSRHGFRSRTIGIMAAVTSTVLLLALVPGPAPALIVLSIVAGAARGLFTLLNATAISDRWGIESYAALNGVFNLPISAAAALAPLFGAALSDILGGDPQLFAALAILGMIAAVLAWAADASTSQDTQLAIDPKEAHRVG